MTTQKTGGGAGIRNTDAPVSEPSSSPVDAVLQGTLGKKLRETYQEVVAEPVPDKFLNLLAELRKKEGENGEDQQS